MKEEFIREYEGIGADLPSMPARAFWMHSRRLE